MNGFSNSTFAFAAPAALQAAPAPQGWAGATDEPIFDQATLEELTMRRFNPLPQFTAQRLTSALDAFDLANSRRRRGCGKSSRRRERTLTTVKAKREEAIALRPRLVEARRRIARGEGPAGGDRGVPRRSPRQARAQSARHRRHARSSCSR